jgi:hypothetical protein
MSSIRIAYGSSGKPGCDGAPLPGPKFRQNSGGCRLQNAGRSCRSTQGDTAMDRLSLKDYIVTRVDDQIGWYERSTARAQKAWKALRLAEVIAAALIPFAAAYAAQSVPAQLAVGLLGVLVAIITGVLGVYKLQENWLLYRGAAEALKREKFLLVTGVAPYDGENADKEFVARVEGILGKEGEAWRQTTATPQPEEAKPPGG